MSGGYRGIDALKTLGIAAGGYAIVLLSGFVVGRLFATGDSLADLGIYALTAVFLAPLGAAAGAYVGLRKYGNGWSRSSLLGAGLVLLAGVGALVVTRSPFAVTVALVGVAVVTAYQAGRGLDPRGTAH